MIFDSSVWDRKIVILHSFSYHLGFSYKLLPSEIPDACLVLYQAGRLLSTSQKVVCLPIFHLQVLEHLWICSQISLFFTTVKSDMSGANLVCSVVLVSFSFGSFYILSLIFSLLWSILTCIVGSDIANFDV